MDQGFGAQLRHLRQTRGLSLRALAALVHYSAAYLHEIETGRKPPTTAVAERCDTALDAGGALLALAAPAGGRPREDELDALELARRVSASDVGGETLARLESAVDDLAVAYPVSQPTDLLGRVVRHLGYAARLVDARKTLDEHCRLLVAAGWLSLLAATLHIDLQQRVPARAHLATAATLARQANHSEIAAWSLETRAWSLLTDGEYRRAAALSRAAQRTAPSGSSAVIQATAQEGRAWARMGARRETYDALGRVDRLVANLPRPALPQHHYRYDPDKSAAYTATILTWIGDPAAEHAARAAIARLRGDDGWARRVASAQLDLGLALLAADRPDEACAVARAAIASGRVVPSNRWRAAEVVAGVAARGLPEAGDLREAYASMG